MRRGKGRTRRVEECADSGDEESGDSESSHSRSIRRGVTVGMRRVVAARDQKSGDWSWMRREVTAGEGAGDRAYCM